MECGDRGEGGGCQVTGRWLHRGETYSVPAGGSHHGPVQTPQCHHSTWGSPQWRTGYNAQFVHYSITYALVVHTKNVEQLTHFLYLYYHFV